MNPGARRRSGEESVVQMKHLQDFFTIPSEIMPEFWKDTLQRNRLSLLVICIMIFGMELYNIARVLLWSRSGLATLNNRIYFGLYCALLLSAALYLLLSRLLQKFSVPVRWGLQYGAVLFFLLWHVCLNAYDLYRDPSSEVSPYFTAVLGLAVFIQMPPLFSLLTHGTAYFLFMALTASYLEGGVKLNLTFTAIVALAISFTMCHHSAITISQRLEILQINQRLQAMARRDPLTGLLNKSAFQKCAEPSLKQAGPGRKATLLIADLDDFKLVNDHYGHPCGDFVLRETALALQAAFPDAEGLGRIGGDEFAVLIAGTDQEQLEQSVRSFLRSAAAITWHGQAVASGCSVGGCQVDQAGVSYDRLYGSADRALYQAKHRGKGQFFLARLE